MTTVQILTGARDLISDPDRWTQYANARDADGNIVSTDNEHSVCWCMGGAVWRVVVLAKETPRAGFAALGAIRQAARAYASEYNDSHSHKQVLALLDRTIQQERAKADGKSPRKVQP